MVGVLAASGVLIFPASARADVREPIALHYDATGACPSEAEFVTLVRTHTSRWTRVAEGESPRRTMRVVVSEGADQTTGSLVVTNPSGIVSERDISGPSCAGVARALALMVAVAIDPLADLGETSEVPPEGGRIEPPRAERRAAGDRPSTATPTRTPSFRGAPRVSLELRAETTSAVVRGALLGVGVSMKLELPPDAGPEWLRTWRPNIGIGIRQSLPKELALRGGSAEFLWTAGHLRLCPIRFTIERIFALSPCAEVNVGRLNAAARGFAEARAVSTFWYDLGASLWTSVNLSSRVFIGSTLLVTAPVTRQPFALASGTIVSDAPVIGVLGGIGLGVKM